MPTTKSHFVSCLFQVCFPKTIFFKLFMQIVTLTCRIAEVSTRVDSPSWPSCCSLCRTFAAMSPSSSHGGEASVRSSETLVVCQPSCSYLVTKTADVQNTLLKNTCVANSFDLNKECRHVLSFLADIKGWGLVLLTPPSNGMFPTSHNVFTLLVFSWDHLKLDAGVPHPMVSATNSKHFLAEQYLRQTHLPFGCTVIKQNATNIPRCLKMIARAVKFLTHIVGPNCCITVVNTSERFAQQIYWPVPPVQVSPHLPITSYTM